MDLIIFINELFQSLYVSDSISDLLLRRKI